MGVVLVSVLYQFLFKSLIFDVLGHGRIITSIKDLKNVQCEKVDELGLEGCEDMWLHDKTGFLYMACSDTASRIQWLPASVFYYPGYCSSTDTHSIDRLNASGRGLTDRLAILDTRGAGRLASRIKWITPENFSGINGDSTLNLHGLDIRAEKDTDMLRILLVNHRPPVDPITGEYLDASLIGANSTIEQFLTKAGTTTMRHIKSHSHPLIQTPNRVAWVTDSSFVISNDHSAKIGLVGVSSPYQAPNLPKDIAPPPRHPPLRRKHCPLHASHLQPRLLPFHKISVPERSRPRSRRTHLRPQHAQYAHRRLLTHLDPSSHSCDKYRDAISSG